MIVVLPQQLIEVIREIVDVAVSYRRGVTADLFGEHELPLFEPFFYCSEDFRSGDRADFLPLRNRNTPHVAEVQSSCFMPFLSTHRPSVNRYHVPLPPVT